MTAFAHAAGAFFNNDLPPVACCGAASGNTSAAGRDYTLMLLSAWGIPTLDLGVDVSPEAFLSAITQNSLQYAVCVIFTAADAECARRMHTLAEARGMRGSFRLVVCGCGYVGQSVIRLAKFLGWNVTALDDREEFVSMARLAGADEVICGPFGETIPKTASYSSTCYVVVTREHRYDRECLDAILAREPGYVGMMGSHTRSDRMRQSLAESGVDKEKIARIHAPVGLEIGAVTPQEIAVSIIAQIMQEKAKFLQGSAFPPDLMAALKEEGPDGSHAILALITAQRGSTPREAGARMLVYPDGKTVGTIGGGLMEAEVIRRALQSLEDPSSFRPYTITIDMSGRPGSMKDMVCGGVTDVFLELL